MKKLKKFAVAFGIAGMLVSGVGAAIPVEAAWSNVEQSHYEKGILIGWADGNSFEVKTSSGKYMVFRSSNDWYKKNLISGESYTYYYYTNKYGQNIINKIQK
ncbi:hypothetical protein [Peribacillus huizhouensis]|uniref:Uncharacterized protein n=1 Tax=Peribacillus huizhouensis TaxID=1501239 RepID=A0ABR6CVP1_9BACI|nr:hypothetical protein [Peribacillus huizhouensis]MBA9029034.1 hypothetical protein [Peribacillus huizhouensis]